MNYGEKIEPLRGRKRHAPAAARNSAPIAEVLAKELPASGTVLEIASGTGEHAVFMARRFPSLDWQPTDADPEALGSIAAWAGEAGMANLCPPIAIDAAAPPWPVERADAIVCINMTHIAPWAATEGLFGGAAGLLYPGAPLIIYGPFIEDEVETTPSNLAFDADLRRRNPAWGLRNRADLDRLAGTAGLKPAGRNEMPANNLMLVYRRC